MKRITFLLIGLLITSVAGQARTLRFVYVAHDVSTPVELLVQKFERYFEDLEDEADDESSMKQTILYLSSGTRPIIANMKSAQRDDENFNRLVSELYERNYHEVDTDTDVDKIIDLLSENDFLSPDGSLDVSRLQFEFYITPTVWTMGQNRSLIAALFHSLDISKYFEDGNPRVTFKMYLPTVEDVNTCLGTDGKPFGDENVDNINNLLTTPDFIGTYQ